MFAVRKSDERGTTELPWLRSRHTFSFGDYYDEQHMGYRTLRVINDDIVAPGQGFGTHGHRDMEIITLVLAGALEHRDSMGHGTILKHDQVQCMSAGTGIRHSEFNPSQKESVHFLQIWILPREVGVAPHYLQREFPRRGRHNKWQRIAGGDGHHGDNALPIVQDADVYLAELDSGASIDHPLRQGRGAWLHVIRGRCEVVGTELREGDGAACEHVARVEVTGAAGGCELLLFDLGD